MLDPYFECSHSISVNFYKKMAFVVCVCFLDYCWYY